MKAIRHEAKAWRNQWRYNGNGNDIWRSVMKAIIYQQGSDNQLKACCAAIKMKKIS